MAARRDLAATLIEERVAEVLATAPPLSDEQCDRIAEVLRGRPVPPLPSKRPKQRPARAVVVGESR
ncbi:hypothetical protein AAIB33_08060 [Microbacterium sp. AZCO]|uniref:hypothetical protein n=1 Tax=Microbacterium sp. AZCO TaxID=3142976 RepID=UPI0031F359C9